MIRPFQPADYLARACRGDSNVSGEPTELDHDNSRVKPERPVEVSMMSAAAAGPPLLATRARERNASSESR